MLRVVSSSVAGSSSRGTRFLFAFAGFSLLTASTARAQATNECGSATTIDSLGTCVEHCKAQGFINDQGVANSLLVKLHAAQAAEDRGQTATAVNLLGAFINEVQAHASKHFAQPHADHMVMHAQMVISALEKS